MKSLEIDQERQLLLHKLEKKLGYCFQNISLFSQALTHKSYVNENPQGSLEDNERLEFLGDAVLGLCVSDFIFKKYEHFPEGQLTRLRAALVNEKNLARIAGFLDLGTGLLLGRGEELSGSREKKTLLADALEAVIAAVFLDADFATTQRVLDRLIETVLEKLNLLDFYFDYKTALQEFCQKQYKTLPVYTLIKSDGPEHARIFTVEVSVQDGCKARGTGTSKKEAQQQAAKQIWEMLKNEENR
ncbi:MAG TPA: ribonuclease III [Smithella sp.]|nr:ribonuclease III [Smithella sp.]